MLPLLTMDKTNKVKIFEMREQIDAVYGVFRSRHKTEEVLSAGVSTLTPSSFPCSISHYELLENTMNEETESSPPTQELVSLYTAHNSLWLIRHR